MTLIGTGEIKERHGITRVQVFRLIASDDFPEPVAQTGGGRIWDSDDVERSIARLRRTGRLTSDNRLVPNRYLPTETSA